MPQPWRQQLEQLLPNSPLRPLWDLHGLSLREITVENWRGVSQDHIFGHAAELGYYFLFSLFPTLFCAGSIPGIVLRSSHQFPAKLLQVLMLLIPAVAFDIVITTFNDAAKTANSGKITFGSIAAVWSASIGVSAIQDTLNAVFRIVEPRSYLAARVSAFLLMVVLSILGVFCLACMFGGNLGAAMVYSQVPDHVLGGFYVSSVRILAWVGAACLPAMSLSLLYYWAPGRRPRCWRRLTPGVGFGRLAAASLGFRAYLHVFKSCSATYGSLGAGIILLTWFYLSGLMFLVGAEIDMVIDGGGR